MDRDRVRIEIRQIEKEPDAQTAARSIGGIALYAKATELQEFGELKFGELKRNRLFHIRVDTLLLIRRDVKQGFELYVQIWNCNLRCSLSSCAASE